MVEIIKMYDIPKYRNGNGKLKLTKQSEAVEDGLISIAKNLCNALAEEGGNYWNDILYISVRFDFPEEQIAQVFFNSIVMNGRDKLFQSVTSYGFQLGELLAKEIGLEGFDDLVGNEGYFGLPQSLRDKVVLFYTDEKIKLTF